MKNQEIILQDDQKATLWLLNEQMVNGFQVELAVMETFQLSKKEARMKVMEAHLEGRVDMGSYYPDQLFMIMTKFNSYFTRDNGVEILSLNQFKTGVQQEPNDIYLNRLPPSAEGTRRQIGR